MRVKYCDSIYVSSLCAFNRRASVSCVICTLCLLKQRFTARSRDSRGLMIDLPVFRHGRSLCGIFTKRSYKRSPCRTHKHARTHARTHNVISWRRQWWLLALPG